MHCRCSGACWLIGICTLQLLTIAARQTFDFLGLQWTAITANFCQIISLIVGLCGAYRHNPRLVAVYSTWSLVWIGWNTFVIFIYLDIGSLNLCEHAIALHLGFSDSLSWFKDQLPACELILPDLQTPPPKCVDYQTSCFLNFRHVEVFQSAVQLFLSILGFSVACYAIGILKEEEDNFDFIGEYTSSRKSKGVSTTYLQPLVKPVIERQSSSSV